METQGGASVLGSALQSLRAMFGGVQITGEPGDLFTVGKVLQGVVKGASAEGGVLLEVSGKQVAAKTNLPLTVGARYEFVVASREPRVILNPTHPVGLPSLGRAVAEGVLGVGGPQLAALTRPGPDVPLPPEAQPVVERLTELAQRIGDERVRASDLIEYHSRLGHDQEARLLRLLTQRAPPSERSLAPLRTTLKAQALTILDRPPAEAEASRANADWARAVVQALGAVEVENAVRAENGGPQIMPLPLASQENVRDARMFLHVGEEESAFEGAQDRSRPFKVVLLLELTNLGPLRVDLEYREPEIGLQIYAADAEAESRLRAAMPALEEVLEDDGLTVRQVTLRVAGPAGIPVADLLPPAASRHSDFQVDVHV